MLFPYALALLYLFVPPVSTLMVYDLATWHVPKRTWMPMARISPNLVAAVVASEDGAFCSHWGFDFAQMEKSIDRATGGGGLRGASTITQQTAKNLFLWNDRSWLRKLLEAPLALWLELTWSKKRILEVYLNIAEWGPGVYGAEAAARVHFNMSAQKLPLAQSALLAAALPNPIQRPAGHPTAGQVLQASVIVRRALGNGPDLSCLK